MIKNWFWHWAALGLIWAQKGTTVMGLSFLWWIAQYPKMSIASSFQESEWLAAVVAQQKSTHVQSKTLEVVDLNPSGCLSVSKQNSHGLCKKMWVAALGAPVAVGTSRHFFGTTLALLWHYFGTTLALLWHYFGIVNFRLQINIGSSPLLM